MNRPIVPLTREQLAKERLHFHAKRAALLDRALAKLAEMREADRKRPREWRPRREDRQ